MPKRSIKQDADTKWLRWAESRFVAIAGKDTDIDRESFKNALEVQNVFFANRVFDLADKDKSGTVSLQEMMDVLRILNQGTQEEKIKFFFDVYDLNDDGTIDVVELRTLLNTGNEESSMHLSEEKLTHLTDTLFESADRDQSGSVSFDEFMGMLKGYPDILNNLSLSAASGLMSSPKKKHSDWRSFLPQSGYFRNNYKWIVFKLSFFLINGALFAEAAYRHSSNPDANWSFLIARGCGQALNFSCAVVVVMMLRTTQSVLRATWLNYVLPFDESIQIHKTIGHTIFVLATAHTLAHVGNALILEAFKNFTAAELLITDPNLLEVGLRVGKLTGSAFITGWLIYIFLLIIVLGSMSCIRRSGHFQIFFWTHKICYVVFWFLLILHGPKFWCWFLGPAILFTLEKFSQTKIVRIIRFGKTYVKEANLLPSGVTHLVLTKPRHFKYKSGDYIFIQVPVIAKHEWHPFTISSAPEQDDISLHIRSAGNWTKSLYRYFNEQYTGSRRRMSLSARAASILRRGSMFPGHRKSGDGEVNIGFEPSLPGGGKPEEGEAGVQMTTVIVEDGTAFPFPPVSGDDYDDYDDDDEVQPPPVLSIKRMSYAPEISSPSDMRRLREMSALALQTSIEEEGDEEEEERGEAEITNGNGRRSGMATDEERSPDETENDNDNESSGKPASSPIRTDSLIQALSERTNKIQTIFNLNTNRKIQVHMQGPYGTPSTNIFHSDHAVLIGAGIGVTPFASIIQSIMCRHRNIINRCPNCQHSWVDEEKSKQALRVKKVDFVWLNRNHTAFEWFVELLLGLEGQQSKYSLDRFLDIHLYMTSIRRFDMKNVGLQMALDLVHEKDQRDMLTGLRTKLQAGRPDWEKLFQKFKDENKGRVAVFFCGAPALGNIINKYCRQFGFIFHKENF